MSSRPPTALNAHQKPSNTGHPTNTGSTVQQYTSNNLNELQRRTGGLIGAGAGSGSHGGENSQVPRNNQTSRRKHKNRHRPNNPSPGDHNDEEQEEAFLTSGNSRKGRAIPITWDVSTPRELPYDYRPGPSTSRRTRTWGVGSGYHANDKARYINSNYRFLVNPTGDYRINSKDPDSHVPWEQIVQVIAPSHEISSCPICISDPVAPRMTKCGHIFACHAYRVRVHAGQEMEGPKDGEDVVLRLMMLKRGSTLALPRDESEGAGDFGQIPWHFAAGVMDYARVMKATKDDMEQQFSREISDLDTLQKHDEVMYGEDGHWCKKAVKTIQFAIEGLAGIPGSSEIPPPQSVEKADKGKERAALVFTSTDAQANKSGYPPPPEKPVSQIEDLEKLSLSDTPTQSKPIGLRSLGAASAPKTTPYFFYQALPKFFLAPLDIRILRVAFGDYHNFPSAILPRIENVITGHTVDDDLRRRLKWLAHLPAGCEIGFLECDWTDVVAQEVLQQFEAEISRRRRQKREKEVREERDRVRAERAMGHEIYGNGHGRRESLSKAEIYGADGSSNDPQGLMDGVGPNLSSGADMGLLDEVHPLQRTVWGTRAIAAVDEPASGEANDSGWLEDWEQDIFDNDIAMLEQDGVHNFWGF
ncbi:Similar to Uncharacterized RING finger protein P8B7.23; acc. no. O94271 [Pyronema omphalodes CBS 100304]|uniref:Similar to Uncharacterized RING finger protein P8B7.23 acc. no. O94271 n=1 Tax=Pyronema omphalodes (strain CBS 100304) TaxID=1076935 RepID=U4KY41_PYROM|nr:Similar to Uncharacterized RING finger protein P8B7.23; acc. no. O94271 [Pyronema omphalodes CBS 100304]